MNIRFLFAFLGLFLFIILTNCKKNKEFVPANCYFKCKAGNDSINVEYPPASPPGNSFSMIASTVQGMAMGANENDCSYGKACFDFSFIVYNKRGKGNYTPYQLSLTIPEGPNIPYYLFADNFQKPETAVITITGYKQGTVDNPGRLTGYLQATLRKYLNGNPVSDTLYPVSCEFSCPLVDQ